MDAPDAPDPYDTAAAQQGAEIAAGQAGAILNNYDENNPYAKVKYKKTGYDKIFDAQGNKIKVPTYKKITTFKPEQQHLFDQQNKLAGSMNDLALSQVDRLDSVLGDPVDLSGAPEVNAGKMKTASDFFDPNWTITRTTGEADYSGDRRRVEDAIMSRYDEMFGKQMDQLDSRLAAQGFSPDSVAAKSDFYDMGKVYNDAAMQAILAGGQEQSRLAGLDMARDAFANDAYMKGRATASQDATDYNTGVQWDYGTSTDAYNRYIQSILLPRSTAINEIASLMGGGQVTLPDFPDPYQQAINAPDIMGFVSNNYAQESANYRNMMSGLFGLAGQIIP